MTRLWPIITRTTHERELAAKDAEIAGLMARIKRADESFARLASTEIQTNARAEEQAKTIRSLEARLAKFDSSNRPRNERGQFEKDAQA
jgi:septal ring factor EnvC (AmiA/AmiB activator)